MDFFKNLGSNIGKTAKTVTKKSEELVEITKLNLTIGNEEDKIKKLLLEIGAELYGRFSQGESYDDYLNGKCTQIKELEDTIQVLKEKVKNLKGQKTCGDCCSNMNEDANFCPSCGNKTEEMK